MDFTDILNRLMIMSNQSHSDSEDIKDELKNVSDNIKDTNDFLKNDSDDGVDYSTPSNDSFDDSKVKSGLDTTFKSVQNMFTKTSSAIVIPVPFTNKSITIPANYIQVQLDKFDKAKVISTFVQVMYAYVISKYIFKDITKVMDSIKSGSILNSNSDSDIKADMM